jgi:hypothetical protein
VSGELRPYFTAPNALTRLAVPAADYQKFFSTKAAAAGAWDYAEIQHLISHVFLQILAATEGLALEVGKSNVLSDPERKSAAA